MLHGHISVPLLRPKLQHSEEAGDAVYMLQMLRWHAGMGIVGARERPVCMALT